MPKSPKAETFLALELPGSDMHHPTAQDLRRRKIRDWLFALLRFSVTLEPGDRAAVMAMADEMDRLGFMTKKPEFSFFLRTTTDVCNALADREHAGRNQILREHLARIDDQRLRRAFLAVFNLEAAEVGQLGWVAVPPC